MMKRGRFHLRVRVGTADVPAVGQAGEVLLTHSVVTAGLAVLTRDVGRGRATTGSD